jgi:hypothetical protein
MASKTYRVHDKGEVVLVVDGKFKYLVRKHPRDGKSILTCACKVFQVTHECSHVAAVRETAPEKYYVNALNNVRMDEWFGNIQVRILNFLKKLRY